MAAQMVPIIASMTMNGVMFIRTCCPDNSSDVELLTFTSNGMVAAIVAGGCIYSGRKDSRAVCVEEFKTKGGQSGDAGRAGTTCI